MKIKIKDIAGIGDYIFSKKTPTEKENLKFIKKFPMCLSYVKNPSREVFLIALKANPTYAKNPVHLVRKLAMFHKVKLSDYL